MPKENWPLGVLRSLGDALLALRSCREISPEFEIRWLNLTGFCLRPGFGEGFDAQRAGALWKLYPKGPCHPGHAQVQSEWWVLWRRISAGLRPGQQRQIVQDLSSVCYRTKKGAGEKSPPSSCWKCGWPSPTSNFSSRRTRCGGGGNYSPKSIPVDPSPSICGPCRGSGHGTCFTGRPTGWCHRGRLRMVPGDHGQELEKSAGRRIRRGPHGPQDRDRTRDLSVAALEEIRTWLSGHEKLAPLCELVERVVPVDVQEAQNVFGESLPGGLVLKNRADALLAQNRNRNRCRKSNFRYPANQLAGFAFV